MMMMMIAYLHDAATASADVFRASRSPDA